MTKKRVSKPTAKKIANISDSSDQGEQSTNHVKKKQKKKVATKSKAAVKSDDEDEKSMVPKGTVKYEIEIE